MTREALLKGQISLDSIREQLTVCKGDLFFAASYLGCTARELDSYIRANGELQAWVAGIERVKQNEEYNKMSVQQFEDAIRSRLLVYKVDALDALHQLTQEDITTEFIDSEGNAHIGKSAALAKVKMEAAKALVGNTGAVQSSGADGTLAELNALYEKHAPNIAEIRTQTTTLVLRHEKELQ